MLITEALAGSLALADSSVSVGFMFVVYKKHISDYNNFYYFQIC